MAGSERSMTILGFPSAMNKFKLKVFFEKFSGSGTVERIERDDGRVKCIFVDEGALQKFLKGKITEIEFGNCIHPLEVTGMVQDGRRESQESPSPRPPITPRRIDSKLQDALYKNTHYWSSFSQLPAEEGTLCVLAQNIDKTTTIQAIKLHFESKKRACGGLVVCIVTMIDGLLIVFENASDCLACSEKADQKMGKQDMAIFQKKIPTLYERKFVIEGVGACTAQDTLVMFLESCSTKEISPVSCAQQDLQGVYLVEYGTDYDISETSALLHHIQERPLERSKLKAKCLLRTDCLKLIGVPGDASNDRIRLIFESKKRSGGSRVTRIDRTKTQAVLVYFALFEDAERICKKYESPDSSLIINEHPVTVQLYHHSLSKDHEKLVEYVQPKQEPSAASSQDVSKQPLRAFEMEPTSNRKVLDFVLRSDVHRSHLTKFFGSFAAIEILQQQKEKIVMKFTPQKIISKLSQREFEEKCQKNLERFLSNYSTVVRTVDNAKLLNARSLEVYPQVKESYTGHADDLVVSWTPNEPTVAVTGLKETVMHTIQHIETCVNSIVVTAPLNKDQFRTFLYCGIVENLRERFKKLQIKYDEKQMTVTYSGPDSVVHAAQIEALTTMMIESRKMVGVDEMVLKFLSESMQESLEITARIQQEIKKAGAKALILLSDGTPFIKAKASDDFEKAINAIKGIVVTDKINTDQAKSNVIKSPEWKKFLQTLSSNGLCRIYINPSQSVDLVGVRSELKVARAKISGFLDENAIKRFFTMMDYGKARFVIERSLEFSAENCEKYAIKCGLSPEEGGGVFVEGKRMALDYVHQDLMKLRETVLEVPLVLEKPGMKEYYESEDGKQFLSNAERANNVIILAGTNRCSEWVQHNKRLKSVAKPTKSQPKPEDILEEEEVLCLKLPNSSAILAVWKTDISRHKCDVIVNASNETLTLLPGGVSGVIKNYDVKNRNQIQNEMDEIVKEHGNSLPGEAFLTTAGNLPACKSIVHAIGPRWHQTSLGMVNPKLILKQCILRSLQLTEQKKHRSIAIPAISCGVFGGKPTVCIPLIVETVEEYFKETPNSVIKKVHFVEYSARHVLDEFVNSLKKYKDLTPVKSKSPSVSSASTSPMPVASPQGSCTVNLVQGDIATQQADVLVNVTDPPHLAKMASGPTISQILAKRAGSAVINQCRLLPRPYNLGSVFETDAGGLPCKKLYHALVTHYDQQISPSVIQSVVSRCLKMADNDMHTSIVFPALATGGFRHPPQVVAKLMRQEIANFSGTNLKSVTIMLYPGNQTTINAFNAEFNSGVPVGTPLPAHQPSSSQYTFTQHGKKSEKMKVTSGQKSSEFQKIDAMTGTCGGVVVSISKGDITDQETDVIVNSTNSSFALNQGMVSKQILARGGMKIQTEASAERGGGDYVITSGGSLPCNKIIHLVTPTDPKDLQKKIAKVLKEVEKLRMKSVSLPAFGTGVLNLEIDMVGSIMRASIEQFVKFNKKLKYLATVTIVIFDDNKLSHFKTGFFNPNLKKGILERLLGFGESFLNYLTQLTVVEEKEVQSTFGLYFYSNNEEDINQAVKCISDEGQKMVTKTVIMDDAISRLTDWERFEILEIEKKYNIQITEQSDKYLKRLVLEGLTNDVTKANGDIRDVLREFTAAEVSSTYVVWEKKVKSDKWKEFSPRSAHVLEKAYMARSNGSVTSVQIPEFSDGKVTSHSVDLSSLDGQQQGQSSPKVRRKIKEKSGSDVPDFWDDMQGKQIVNVPLQPNSTEYRNVEQTLAGQTPFYSNIVSIERIQNTSLFKQYVAKKNEITEKLKNFAGPIERQLFHGTNEDDKIQLHGFDRSYAGRNATMFGRGVYFATEASYSHGYAAPNPQGHRRMFLADVITGEFCAGNQNLLAPPPRATSSVKNDIYDSVVNQLANPTIFVIFKDASAYPAYKITYV